LAYAETVCGLGRARTTAARDRLRGRLGLGGHLHGGDFVVEYGIFEPIQRTVFACRQDADSSMLAYGIFPTDGTRVRRRTKL
jgi:hypothetical protein